MEIVATNRTNLLGRTKPKRDVSLFGTAQEDNPSEARQRSFLNHHFDSLPVFEVDPSMLKDTNVSLHDGEVLLSLGDETIDFGRNIINLRVSAQAYCKAHGSDLEIKPNANPLLEMQYLYKEVERCSPESNEIGIDYDIDRHELIFIEYVYCKYDEYKLVFLTTSFLEHLKGPYRKFFCEFLSLVKATMCIVPPKDHFDFAYTLGVFDEEFIEEDLKEDKKYAEFVGSYLSGHINDILEEVDGSPWKPLTIHNENTVQRFKKLIDGADSPELKKFVEVAIEGIYLMGDECIDDYRQNLNHCNIIEFDETDQDEEVIPIERVMAICYGEENDDPIVQRTIDLINNDGCNFLPENLYEAKVISSSYDRPYEGTQFPKRWFDWYSRYYEAKVNYEQTYKNVK